MSIVFRISVNKSTKSPIDFHLLPKYTILHMLRNTYNTDKTLGRDILSLLQQRLPPGWKAVARAGFSLNVSGPRGKNLKITLETRANLEPKDTLILAQRLRKDVKTFDKQTIPLVVSPFISLSTRQRLTELGISYADPTGNLRIVASRPALYIETQGAGKNPNREKRPARSLKGAKAGRIVRALCDGRPPFAVLKLAEETGVDSGYVSRVLAFLRSEDLIERDGRGPITSVRWRKLIERWARDYSFMESNRVISYLEPRDPATLPSRLASVSKKLAITGSVAAATMAPVAPARLLTAYVVSPESVAKRLGLIYAESGANVLLVEPTDPTVFDSVRKCDGVSYAPLSQVAVDLLGGPGRGPSEAQALLDWMESHESSWRG